MSKEFSTSKLGNRYKMKYILDHDEEFHTIIRQLRCQEGNKRCADCNSRDNNWCSVNIGVFLCIHCAQLHRGVGTHISKVKSCSGTYLWHPDEVSFMNTMGNIKANEKYGGYRDDGKSPTTKWVIDKYSK